MQRLATKVVLALSLASSLLAACGGDKLAGLQPQVALLCGAETDNLGTPSPASTCAEIDFGDVAAQTTKTMVLRIGNTGRAALKIAPTSGLDGNARNTLSATIPPASVAAGQRTDVLITFAPTFSLMMSQKYLLDTNDPTHPHLEIPIKGNGVGHPKPVASDQALDFGDVMTGITKILAVHLTNQGNVPMTIISAMIQVNANKFTAVPAKGTVQPLESIDQPVAYSPPGAGVDASELDITFDSVDSEGVPTGADLTTIKVALRGESLPQLQVMPNPLDFGTLVWEQPKDLSLTLANDGLAPVRVLGADLSPDSSLAFSVSHHLPFPTTVQPLTTAAGAITVTYAPPPTMGGIQSTDTGTLILHTDDPNNPYVQIPITGGCNCSPPGPVISVSPTSMNYNTISPGYGDRTAQFVISSLGTAPVEISSIAPAAGSPPDFVVGSEVPPGTMIAPGKTKIFSISYHQRPTDTRNQLVGGTVDVNSNDPNHPTVPISLTGSCAAPQGSPDSDMDGIPDICDACQFDGPTGAEFINSVMGDGINFSNAHFHGQTTNVLTSVPAGTQLTVDFDFQITGQGPQCDAMHSNNVTQYYVGIASGAANGTACIYSADVCLEGGGPLMSGSAMLTAPTDPGTYYVQYNWGWSMSGCSPDQFMALGPAQGFAAFCVK